MKYDRLLRFKGIERIDRMVKKTAAQITLNPVQRRILASIMGGVGMGIVGGTTEGIVGTIAQAKLQRQLAQLKQKKKKKKAKHPVHRRLKKHATAEDVARIFEDQGTDPEMPPMQPRNEGWRVVKEELTEEPGGMLMQKTTRVRSFGQLHKLAFVHGFMDELAKKGAIKAAQDLPSSAFYGAEKTGPETVKVAFINKLIRSYEKYRHRRAIKEIIRRAGHLGAAVAIGAGAHHVLVGSRRKDETKQAAEKTPMLIEPHLKKRSDDPFSALRNKLRIVAGRASTVGGPAASTQPKTTVKETSG